MVMSVVQYFKCVPVKLETVTDIWRVQCPANKMSNNQNQMAP